MHRQGKKLYLPVTFSIDHSHQVAYGRRALRHQYEVASLKEQ